MGVLWNIYIIRKPKAMSADCIRSGESIDAFLGSLLEDENTARIENRNSMITTIHTILSPLILCVNALAIISLSFVVFL
jgi:hypothetical protein